MERVANLFWIRELAKKLGHRNILLVSKVERFLGDFIVHYEKCGASLTTLGVQNHSHQNELALLLRGNYLSACLISVARALDFFHSHNLVLGDLHPNNIVFIPGGNGECQIHISQWQQEGRPKKHSYRCDQYPFYNERVAKLQKADDVRAYATLYVFCKYKKWTILFLLLFLIN